jgi:hypothetical protein
MPYDNCLRLHFQFCIRMYLASPPPGTQAYSTDDVEDLQEAVGVHDGDESLPELSDPVWNSALGQEVLRSIMARRGAYFTLLGSELIFELIYAFKVPTQSRVQVFWD